MDSYELDLRKVFEDDFESYAAHCLKIRTKNMGVIPFKMGRVQRYLHNIVEEQRKEKSKVRIILLKGRQQGASTYVEGRFYWKVTHAFGVKAYILTHSQDATDNLFKMVQRFHKYCPTLMRPIDGPNNAKELAFSGLDSGYKVGTAGNVGVGRGDTIQFFHGSEVAFWPNAAEHVAGIMQAIPRSGGTEIFKESTANGQDNYFHIQWQLASKNESEYRAVFLPWYWQEEYTAEIGEEGISLTSEEIELRDIYGLTNEQMNWRRIKIHEFSAEGGSGTNKFMQEYPCNDIEAFQNSGIESFIPNLWIERAMNTKGLALIGPKVAGIDPARFGKDRTSIVIRQGRTVTSVRSYKQLDLMNVVGLVYTMYKEEKPEKIYIDVCGLGAGVYDRLVELGLGSVCVPVNAAQSALNDNKYANKRAEMWGLMRDWFYEEPNSIPDLMSLKIDLCAPTFKYDSKGRVLLEKKEDMKKREMMSPDEGDAMALTFAFPIISGNLGQFINPGMRLKRPH